MEPILKSILENKTENYLLPFFWQHDGHDAEIPARVQKIYESGCRAFCVESRPYEHFCEDAWWKTMDIILAEAKKRGITVSCDLNYRKNLWKYARIRTTTGEAGGLH